MRFRLYHYRDEPLSWSVRWALNHKELDFEHILIDSLETAEPKTVCLEILHTSRDSDWIKSGVPALEWLDDAFPESKLLIGSPLQKSHIRNLMHIVETQIQPFCNPDTFANLFDQKNKVMSFLRSKLKMGFEAYEKSLGSESKHFSVSESLSTADLVLVPYLHHMSRFELELSGFHKICRIYEHAKTLASYKATHPNQY